MIKDKDYNRYTYKVVWEHRTGIFYSVRDLNRSVFRRTLEKPIEGRVFFCCAY